MLVSSPWDRFPAVEPVTSPGSNIRSRVSERVPGISISREQQKRRAEVTTQSVLPRSSPHRSTLRKQDFFSTSPLADIVGKRKRKTACTVLTVVVVAVVVGVHAPAVAT